MLLENKKTQYKGIKFTEKSSLSSKEKYRKEKIQNEKHIQ